LAICLQEGIGCKQDLYEALKWLEKAAMQGSEKGQRLLARCHFLGLGTTRNESKAAAIIGEKVWQLGSISKADW
jgi:TPR repeat protein